MVIILVGLFSGSVLAKGGIQELTSPDNNIKVRIELADKIFYSISANNTLLTEKSYLELQLKDQTLGENPRLSAKKYSSINEQINREIPLRNAVVDNHCNVLLLKFKGNYSVEFRAYNDGVAYRFITNMGDKNIEVLDEEVHLQFPSTFDAVLSPTRSFKTSYEISYVESNTADASELDKSTLPILIDSKQHHKILFSTFPSL